MAGRTEGAMGEPSTMGRDGSDTPAQERKARLAAQLRANLRRRKDQARGQRSAPSGAQPGETAGTGDVKD